jgi:hypothetical protein
MLEGVSVGIHKRFTTLLQSRITGRVCLSQRTRHQYLPLWTDHLVEEYQGLPPEAREEIQSSCNETLGRTIQSLLPVLGENHEVIKKLRGLVKGKMPSSPDDFPHNRKQK